MTMNADDFCAIARLQALELEAWIEAGWLAPQAVAEAPRFSDVDVARARLVRDLRDAMGVNDEGIAVVLALLDQIHGLRGVVREVLAGLQTQPEAQRYRLMAAIGEVRERRAGRDKG
jgi:chaperone modulatory protein CbpM